MTQYNPMNLQTSYEPADIDDFVLPDRYASINTDYRLDFRHQSDNYMSQVTKKAENLCLFICVYC